MGGREPAFELVAVVAYDAVFNFAADVFDAGEEISFMRVRSLGDDRAIVPSCMAKVNGTISNVLFKLRTLHNYEKVPDSVVSHVASWRSVPPGQSYPNI